MPQYNISLAYFFKLLYGSIGRGWEFDGDIKKKKKKKKKIKTTTHKSMMLTGAINPENLLKSICCKSKKGKKQCQTKKYNCMRTGMSHVSTFGVCLVLF